MAKLFTRLGGSSQLGQPIDNGSQRSYASNKVRGGLGLQSVSVETLSIKTFGVTEEGRQTYDVVNLGVATKCGPGLEIPILVCH